MLTALFGVVIYTGFFVGAFDQFVSPSASPELIAQYAAEQGIQAETPEQIARLTAEIVAQTALAAFTTFVGLLVIVFIEPPVRFLAGGDRYSGDIRPTLTAVGMAILVLIVFAFPGLRRFFSLADIGASGVGLMLLLAFVWAGLQLLVWRQHWFEKFFAQKPLKLEDEGDSLWEMS